MGEPVILEAVRTPIGKRNGALRAYRPDALYAKVLDALLERTGIDPGLIGDVVTHPVTTSPMRPGSMPVRSKRASRTLA